MFKVKESLLQGNGTKEAKANTVSASIQYMRVSS